MELLCARFQSHDGIDCLAIWLPEGSASTRAELVASHVEWTGAFDFPVVLVCRLDDGYLHLIGEPALSKQLENIGAESLDWRLTEFVLPDKSDV